MKRILVAALLIILMSGIASAEQVQDWPLGQRNEIPDHIEGVRLDFEEGSNCVDLKNQYLEIVSFLTVLGTQPYGTDWPSYVKKWGSMCGNTRCYMKIFPWCGYYPNGTPYEWVFIVQGDTAFSPMTGPDYLGGYIPGTRSHLVFKEGTRYVSLLACTDGNMYVDLFDRHGNRICSEKITTTVYRNGTNPSNFTQFSFYSVDTDIVSMKVRGSFNGHHFDDLIIGGEPGYLGLRTDYSWATDNMEMLVGAPYLKWGMGYNFYIGEFFTAEEIKTIDLPYVNFDYKQPEIEWGTGIDCAEAMVWVFNQEKDIVNWPDATNQKKHDFTEHVDYENIQPGDVGFIDYDEIDSEGNIVPGDGVIDEVFMIIKPREDGNDCIRIVPGAGVGYSSTEHINMLYDTGTSFVDYRSLKDTPKGGHSPYPKVKGKPI